MYEKAQSCSKESSLNFFETLETPGNRHKGHMMPAFEGHCPACPLDAVVNVKVLNGGELKYQKHITFSIIREIVGNNRMRSYPDANTDR